MSQWPRIQTGVDDDRPAREDEVEYCERCNEPCVGLQPWGRPWQEMNLCHDCFDNVCSECREQEVIEGGEMCLYCAYSGFIPDESFYSAWKGGKLPEQHGLRPSISSSRERISR